LAKSNWDGLICYRYDVMNLPYLKKKHVNLKAQLFMCIVSKFYVIN